MDDRGLHLRLTFCAIICSGTFRLPGLFKSSPATVDGSSENSDLVRGLFEDVLVGFGSGLPPAFLVIFLSGILKTLPEVLFLVRNSSPSSAFLSGVR